MTAALTRTAILQYALAEVITGDVGHSELAGRIERLSATPVASLRDNHQQSHP